MNTEAHQTTAADDFVSYAGRNNFYQTCAFIPMSFALVTTVYENGETGIAPHALVMPFGMRTHEEEGIAKVPGQAESAPASFRPGRIMRRASILALVLFGLYYANYVNGWIGVEDLNLFGKPPGYEDA